MVPTDQPQTSTTRAKPKPIVWDQPTSSSSGSAGPPQVPRSFQPRPGILRGATRGSHSGNVPSNMSHMHPQQQEGGVPPRGLYRPMQSARRSRPHGPRGIMRGVPRPPY